MKPVHLAALVVLIVLLPDCCISAVANGKDQDLLNQGKVLIFEKKLDEAYGAFQRLILEFPRSILLPQAYFLSARCLQLQHKEADALRSYETFLQKFPGDPVLQTQAMDSIIELSASLADEGNTAYKDRLAAGLKSPNKEVCYFAALRCGRLKDTRLASMAVPVLKDILAKEHEADLTNRARIALLRLEPKVLAMQPGTQEGRKKAGDSMGETKLLHLEIYQNGVAKPVVEMNVPVNLAQLVVAALDESTRVEMRKKGIDLQNILEDLKRLGPTNVLILRDNQKVVKLWIQ